MNKQLIDLHLHTSSSDGKLNTSQVIEEAEKAGMSVISITDHNTVNAYDTLRECRHLFSGKIVTGAELSTSYQGELLEILCYGIDIEYIKKFISQNYLSFREKTLTDRLVILKQYRKKGVVMSDEFCYNMEHHPEKYYQPDKESCRGAFLNEIVRHPENAEFFGGKQQMDEVTIRTYLRNHYGCPSSKLYVDMSSVFPSFETLVNAVHEAGGLAFMAHCFLYSKNITDNLHKIAKKYKLDGFECYHSHFTKEQSEYLCNLCDKNNMYKSGGSDFHGGTRTDCILGKSTGGISLDSSLANDWLKGLNNYV